MKRITAFLSILVLSYLCGAFYSANFNIVFWTAECRGITAFFGVFIAFAAASFPFIDELYK